MPTKLKSEPDVLPPAEDLRILLAYQDDTIGRQALRICLQLIHGAAADTGLQQQVWSFASLVPAELRSTIMHDATDADMLIIASHGNRELPAHVKNWLEEWADTHEDKDVALVGVVDQMPGTSEAASPCLAFLSTMARQGRTRFFAKSVSAPRANLGSGTASIGFGSNWGINE